MGLDHDDTSTLGNYLAGKGHGASPSFLLIHAASRTSVVGGSGVKASRDGEKIYESE